MNGLALTSAAASSCVTTSLVTPGGRVRFVIEALDQTPPSTGWPSGVRGGDQLPGAACRLEQTASAPASTHDRTTAFDTFAFMTGPPAAGALKAPYGTRG